MDSFYAEAIQGKFTQNCLTRLYFSIDNINILQNGIRYKIFKLTNGKHIIGKQSEQDLKIVMRSIYLQYGKSR